MPAFAASAATLTGDEATGSRSVVDAGLVGASTGTATTAPPTTMSAAAAVRCGCGGHPFLTKRR
jgi:hypothetical protein